MKILYKSTLILFVLLLSSCATIISGSRQQVEINSDPNSAIVYINGAEIGKTPVQKNLKRNQDYRIVLKVDGYKPYETRLDKKFNAWYIGNIAFGGLIGLIVDPITGAIFKLKPQEFDGSPKPGTTHHTKNQKLVIKVSMEIDPNAEQIGQLEKSE
ncbi:PEGA domain-containing protein [Formosa sp. 4Alg 33]|uniref:PEGA domain-containing protein n=1 Tax=Formosa sp. 4Alg 33 TaxID=3382189 RepID=UPI003D9C16EC